MQCLKVALPSLTARSEGCGSCHTHAMIRSVFMCERMLLASGKRAA